MLGFYGFNLIGFVLINSVLLYRYTRSVRNDQDASQKEQEAALASDDDGELKVIDSKQAVYKFLMDYFPGYAFAVAADWIQGPHIYAIYKYDKNLPEKVVAALYAAGFISGAVAAFFAGQLADHYGRRRACLTYGVMYIITCLSMLSDNLIILFVGRLTGGVATTLLFSVFDAWMVSEYHTRGLAYMSLSLSSVFSYAAVMSPLIAIVMGVCGDAMVMGLGSRVWPFLAGAGCCVVSMTWISTRWGENLGSQESHTSSLKDSISSILTDRKVLALLLATTCFESSMYLFVFFWSAALTSTHAASSSSGGPSDAGLPFGIIFACFMCAMMTGSSIFSLGKPTAQASAQILMAAVLIACLGLAVASVLGVEHLTFYAFIAVEASIGLYFPAMSLLKSEVITDSIRGSVYSMMRLPLNIFVVVTHSLDKEGDSHRNNVFVLLAVMLLVSFEALRRTF